MPAVHGAEEAEPAGEVSDDGLAREAAQSEAADRQLSPAAAEPTVRDPPSAEGGHQVSAVQVRQFRFTTNKLYVFGS